MALMAFLGGRGNRKWGLAEGMGHGAVISGATFALWSLPLWLSLSLLGSWCL